MQCPTSRSASWLCSPCTCCCGHRASGGRPATAAAAFLLGVSALLWPVGLALLAVLLAVLLAALLIRRAGLVTVLAALLAGALPVAAYAAWFSAARAPVQPDQERRGVPVVADDVVRGLRGDQAAGRRAGAVPAARARGWPRRCTSGTGTRRCCALPGGRFSARTNRLALHFALRAIAAQPGGYAAAVGHDFALSFYWDRPVHPDAGIVDRYQFADAATAWVPATMRTPGGGTVAGDQAAYNGGRPAPTRAVQPYASWLVSYQRYAYLPGTLLGVILLGGLAGMAVRRRVAAPGCRGRSR